MKQGDKLPSSGSLEWTIEHIINENIYSIRGKGRDERVKILVAKVMMGGKETYEVSISRAGMTRKEAITFAEEVADAINDSHETA